MRAIDAEGRLDDYSVLGVLFRTDVVGMLKEADVSKLDAALDEAIARTQALRPLSDGHLPAHVLEVRSVLCRPRTCWRATWLRWTSTTIYWTHDE